MLVPWVVMMLGAAPWSVKLVSPTMLHLEQPLERGKPARLYVVELGHLNNLLAVNDMYAGLPEWTAAHPTAKDGEWKAEAMRLRGANWAKRAATLDDFKPGAFNSVSLPAGWKTFALPGTKVTLTRECESCEVFAVSEGSRISLAPKLDVSQVFFPGPDVAFLVERDVEVTPASTPEGARVSGLHAVHLSELAAPPKSAATEPRGAFLWDGSGWVTLRDGPSPLARGIHSFVGWTLVKVLGEPVNGFVKVQVGSLGRTNEGWLRVHYTRPEWPGLASAIDLRLEGGVTQVKGVWRYRVVAKNAGRDATPLALLKLTGSFTGPRMSRHDSNYRTLEGLVVPPEGELVLVDFELKRRPHLPDPEDPEESDPEPFYDLVVPGNVWAQQMVLGGFAKQVGTVEYVPCLVAYVHGPLIGCGAPQKLPWPLNPLPGLAPPVDAGE